MIDSPDPLYCTIFIDSALPLGDVQTLVARAAGGRVGAAAVVSPAFEIAIKRNRYANGPAPTAGDEFLAYRYYAEVEPAPRASREAYVAAIGRLLQDLWTRGILAVAACDFEDELPKQSARDRMPAAASTPPVISSGVS